jgi:hypothetical protein
MTRRNVVMLVVVLATASVGARAQDGASRWALDEPVAQGDGVARGNAVTVGDVVITDTTGTLTLTACCGLEDLATCVDKSTYQIEWALDRNVDELARGEDIGVTLSNTRLSGTCPDIDPFVTVSGDNGNPADSLPGLGIAFAGPVGIFDEALAGGRFYATNSDPHNDHDGSVRTLSVHDLDSLPPEGYWHIDIAQRWGLQYEFTWVYREPADDGLGDGLGDDGDVAALCACASTARAVPASLALIVVGLFMFGRSSRRR